LETLDPARSLYVRAVRRLRALCERVRDLPVSIYLNDHVTVEPSSINADATSVVHRGSLSMPRAQPRAIAVKQASLPIDLDVEQLNQVSPKLPINDCRPY
jgi:preprotein translocase subunit SecD